PLFYALAYIFHEGANVGLYGFFKYWLPLLAGSVVIPIWLVARRLKQWWQQVIFLLFPLATASAILYNHSGIPQTAADILLVYAVCWFIYDYVTDEPFFYFFAGGTVAIAYFYHELASLVLALWLVVTVWSVRRPLWRWVRSHWVVSLVILIAGYVNRGSLAVPLKLITYWTQRLI